MKKRFRFLVPVFILAFVLSFSHAVSVPAAKYSTFKWINIKQIEVTAYRLNVRTGPSTQYPVIGQVKRGQILDIIGALGSWYVVHLPNDSVGLLSSTYTRAYSYHNTPEQQDTPSTPTPTPQENLTPDASANTEMPSDSAPTDGLTADEQEMFALVNAERKEQGLPAYRVDMEVVKVARTKAKDMADNQYFSHQSPTYGSPFTMLKKFGVSYLAAGENIAGNSSTANAHERLMNSTGHRANILNSQYEYIGIGVVSDDKYGKIFVQMFIKK